jgi:hypothetical protein
VPATALVDHSQATKIHGDARQEKFLIARMIRTGKVNIFTLEILLIMRFFLNTGKMKWRPNANICVEGSGIFEKRWSSIQYWRPHPLSLYGADSIQTAQKSFQHPERFFFPNAHG